MPRAPVLVQHESPTAGGRARHGIHARVGRRRCAQGHLSHPDSSRLHGCSSSDTTSATPFQELLQCVAVGRHRILDAGGCQRRHQRRQTRRSHGRQMQPAGPQCSCNRNDAVEGWTGRRGQGVSRSDILQPGRGADPSTSLDRPQWPVELAAASIRPGGGWGWCRSW